MSDRLGVWIRLNGLGGLHAVLVDPEDYEAVAGYRWGVTSNSGKLYARKAIYRKPQYLHRLILGNPKGFVDHADGDTLNCRKSNLRRATALQNIANSRLRDGTTWQLKGVEKMHNKWRAAIRINGKRTHLGLFLTREAAARAYDAKARELHGEFARLNFSATEAKGGAA